MKVSRRRPVPSFPWILVAVAAVAAAATVSAQAPRRCGAPAQVIWEESFLPRTGTVRLPVLLVHPRNVSPPFPREEYEEQFFGSWPTGSLRDYFRESSYGRFDLVGDVSEWIALDQDDLHYEGPASVASTCGDARWKDLLDEAVRKSTFDWTRYNGDGDDLVDTVVIVHAESARQCSLASNNLCSNEQWYYELTPETDRGYLDTGADGPNGDPLCINQYVVVSGVSCEGTAPNPIGDLTHELGHALGLPDLEVQDGSAGGVGVWDLMGTGGSGADGGSPARPTHLGAWSKVELGWVTPTDLSAPTDVDLAPVVGSPAVYRFASEENPGVEYLLENRQRAGFDGELPGTGLLIWRVDTNMIDYWRDNRRRNLSLYSVNDDENNRGVQVIEADGLSEIRRQLSNGDAGDPFPGTLRTTEFSSISLPRNFSRKSVCDIKQAGTNVRLRFVPEYECP
jgi:M6 family metalloprotease-like protein